MQDPMALVLVAAFVWAVEFVPQVLICFANDWVLPEELRAWIHVWPPPHIADFFVGVIAAKLSAVAPPQTGLPGDMILAFALAFVFLAPSLDSLEPLWTHALAPVTASVLYYSMAPSSRCAQLFKCPVFASLGRYTLEAYLFQYLVRCAIVFLDGRWSIHLPFESAEVFIMFMMVLWLGAGLYAEWVQWPLQRWLKDVSSDFQHRPLSCLLSREDELGPDQSDCKGPL